MTKQNTPAIKKGDTVYIIGNLSEDLLALPEPRLGKVLTVNGAYIMVRPSGLNYDCEFLENEVRIAITATPTEVKEPEESQLQGKEITDNEFSSPQEIWENLISKKDPVKHPYFEVVYEAMELFAQLRCKRAYSAINSWVDLSIKQSTEITALKSSLPTTLLSEGKETVEQWYAAADAGNSITIYKKGEDLDDEMVCEIISNFEYSTSEQWAHAKRIEKLPQLEWQSQHTAKEMDEKQKTNAYLVERVDKAEVRLMQEDIENQKLRKEVSENESLIELLKDMAQKENDLNNELHKEIEALQARVRELEKLSAEIKSTALSNSTVNPDELINLLESYNALKFDNPQ